MKTNLKFNLKLLAPINCNYGNCLQFFKLKAEGLEFIIQLRLEYDFKSLKYNLKDMMYIIFIN